MAARQTKKATDAQSLEISGAGREIRSLTAELAAEWDKVQRQIHMYGQYAMHDESHPLSPAAVIQTQTRAANMLRRALKDVRACLPPERG